MKQYYIGVDIGGTGIKSSLVNLMGDIIGPKRYIKTKIDFVNSTNDILNQVVFEIEQLMMIHSDKSIQGIGIASAGVVDEKKGVIIYSGPTIPGYTGEKIKEKIEAKFKIPCNVLNDVNAAALGEVWKEKIVTENPIIYISLGTGIGGSLIINNEIISGYSNAAGEVGYIDILGKTWQEIGSTSALIRNYLNKKEIISDVNGKDIFSYFDQGDKLAHEVIEEFIDVISTGLMIIIYMCNPQYIIIGGGISERGEKLTNKIEKKIRSKIQSSIFLPEKIMPAHQGNDASIIGAVRKTIINSCKKN